MEVLLGLQWLNAFLGKFCQVWVRYGNYGDLPEILTYLCKV